MCSFPTYTILTIVQIRVDIGSLSYDVKKQNTD